IPSFTCSQLHILPAHQNKKAALINVNKLFRFKAKHPVFSNTNITLLLLFFNTKVTPYLHSVAFFAASN
ncbi:hypothetical protein, partial [Seonamhaeicola marinus]|uniref:hypothetical protein n=1 Tax=Seonamhaeicola marinus TaxID=1912246 RepID=UPI001CA32159